MNANTASNFVTVNQFTTPNMIINMSGLKINQKAFTFSLMLSGSMNGVIYSEPVEITGKVTVELMNWLTLVKDEKVQVKADNEKGFEWIKSGRRVTSFQRYLEKAGWGSIVDSPNRRLHRQSIQIGNKIKWYRNTHNGKHSFQKENRNHQRGNRRTHHQIHYQIWYIQRWYSCQSIHSSN